MKSTLNPPPARHVRQPLSRRQKRLKNVNIGCAASLPFLLFFFIGTLGITEIAALPIFAFGMVLIPVFFFINDRTGKCRLLLTVFRIIGIGLLTAAIASSFICFGFSRTRILYPVKKTVFAAGVRGIEAAQKKKSLLPDRLPANCTDYLFITQPCAIAQDYYPNAYLFFHADTETLKQFAEKLEAASGIECFHEEKPPAQDEEDVNLFNLRGALPGHVYARAADWADCEPDFRYAYYYQRSEGAKLSWFGIGVLIDYDTGTFVAWA